MPRPNGYVQLRDQAVAALRAIVEATEQRDAALQAGAEVVARIKAAEATSLVELSAVYPRLVG